MAHKNTTFSHNIPSHSQHPNPKPKPSMDPIEKRKYQIYHPSSSTTTPHPTIPKPPSNTNTTIHSISNNFSKLYTNHKLLSSSLNPSEKLIHQHPHPEPPVHTTTTSLTKSKSLNSGRRRYSVPIESHKNGTLTNVVKERVLVKDEEKPKKEWKTKELVEEDVMKKNLDVKKIQSLMSRSYSEGFGGVKMGSFSLGGGGGTRRKSFCSSQIELDDFFLSNGVKLVAVDMKPSMQIHAVDCARKAHDSLEKFTARSLACTLKREFDGVYGPAWHCIVGTSFGSFVTHSVGGFMYFSMDQKLYILLFKTTVQKAE